jgi:uroporphyrinogen decarboxylase
MNMSSKERVTAALNHQEPDRTPIFEYVLLSPLADLFLGHPYAGDPVNWNELVREKGWEAAVRQNARDRVKLAMMLGHDMLYITPNPGPGEMISTDSPVIPADDPVAAILARNAHDANKPPIMDECLLVYIFAKEEMNHIGIDLPILAPAYLHGVWTDVELMQTMLLAPEIAHQHFTIMTHQALLMIEKYIALGIEQVGIGGDFAGTRLLISPQAYRTFIVPELNSLSTRLHQAHIYAVNASDGNLWPVIDDFLIGTGVDGYLEIDLHAGMDLRTLKEKYGHHVTLFGNLDCGIELSFGTPDEVRHHTIDCIDAGLGFGGHILCASNAITASVPLPNYLAMISAYRDRFRLPPINWDV